MTGSSAFRPDRGHRLHEQVSLRPEPFGALAYHYGNRRLVFLKTDDLVALVRSLDEHPSAAAAIDAHVGADAPDAERRKYERALANLAEAEVIRER